MALGADISDWRGSFLIHQLHTLALSLLQTRFFHPTETGRRRRCDIRHWGGTRVHELEVLGLANCLKATPVFFVGPACLRVALEAPTGGGLLLRLHGGGLVATVGGLHRGDRAVHRQVLVLVLRGRTLVLGSRLDSVAVVVRRANAVLHVLC